CNADLSDFQRAQVSDSGPALTGCRRIGKTDWHVCSEGVPVRLAQANPTVILSRLSEPARSARSAHWSNECGLRWKKEGHIRTDDPIDHDGVGLSMGHPMVRWV